jgi:hypothetical protein
VKFNFDECRMNYRLADAAVAARKLPEIANATEVQDGRFYIGRGVFRIKNAGLRNRPLLRVP